MPEIRPDSFKLSKGEGRLKGAAVYNPHLWSDEDLKAVFVGRRKELAELTRALIDTSWHQRPQHYLLLGYRGMGKSTLLRRLALEARENPAAAANWLALSFPEEQYTVSNLYELWRNVLDALLDRLEEMGAPPAERRELEDEALALDEASGEDREERALGLLKRTVERRGQGLLLLIDSTDQILSGLAETEPESLWRLREVLLHQPGLFWIGSSYQSLESEGLYHDAFNDFFNYLYLRPLSLEEMRETMLSLARTFGMGPELRGEAAERLMEKSLRDNPERLTALKKMSGGNPRTTVLLYELFSSGQNRDIQGDLNGLLDLMTPLYKARMENLKEQPRKILAHLMEAWAPRSAADLSRLAGLPVTTVSSQLSRLESKGLVEKLSLPQRKKKAYQVAERFFNVWYLMRFASRRLRRRFQWLVEFMAAWYSQAELGRLADSLSSRLLTGVRLSRPGDLEYYRALSLSLPPDAPQRHLLDWLLYCETNKLHGPAGRSLIGEIFDFQSPEDKPIADADDYRRRLKAIRPLLEKCPHPTSPEEMRLWVEEVMGASFLKLPDKEYIARESEDMPLETYQELVELINVRNETVKEWLGNEACENLHNAVLSGAFFPDCPSPEIAYAQICSAFVSKPAAMASAIIITCTSYFTSTARNLSDKWLRDIDQELRKAADDNYVVWRCLGDINQGFIKNYEQAEADYRQAIKFNANDGYSWHKLAILLSEENNHQEEAEAAFRKALEIDGLNSAYWHNYGLFLHRKLNRFEDAEKAYHRALEINNDRPETSMSLAELLSLYPPRRRELEEILNQLSFLASVRSFTWKILGVWYLDKLNEISRAEEAFGQAYKADPQDFQALAGLARCLALRGDRENAAANYRLLLLSDKPSEADGSLSLSAYCLQANLFLHNRDAAAQALEQLAAEILADKQTAFYLLKKQVDQCFSLGLASGLIELMEKSRYADYLQPFSLALRALEANDKDIFKTAPPEIAAVAEDIYDSMPSKTVTLIPGRNWRATAADSN